MPGNNGAVNLADLRGASWATRRQIRWALRRTKRFWRATGKEFGLLTMAEVAAALDVDNDEVTRLHREGQLLAVELKGTTRFPGFQIRDGRLVPVIQELAAMAAERRRDERDVIYWLLSPTTAFPDEKRPADHLEERELVVRAAKLTWDVVW